MPNEQTTFSRFLQIIHVQFGDDNPVELGTRFEEDLGADSLDVVELVIDVEEEFGISIPDDDVDALRTVGQAMKYIEAKIA